MTLFYYLRKMPKKCEPLSSAQPSTNLVSNIANTTIIKLKTLCNKTFAATDGVVDFIIL